MKVFVFRSAFALLAALILGSMLAAAVPARAAILAPDKLVIESTTDVKGRTSPCG